MLIYMCFYISEQLFIAYYFKYLPECVLTVLAWLVPHETAAISAHSVYTIQPCTMSRHFIQSHICKVHACLSATCHLHFWQNDRDLFSCYCGTGGGTNTEIRVSTES